MNDTAAASTLAPARDGADRIAVGLELLPLLAVFTPFLMSVSARWESAGVDDMLVRAAVVAMLSGLGWMKVRRPWLGLAILIGRGLVLTLLIWWSWTAVSAEVAARDCLTPCDASAPLLPSLLPIFLLVAAFVASTVASAVLLARTSSPRLGREPS